MSTEAAFKKKFEFFGFCFLCSVVCLFACLFACSCCRDAQPLSDLVASTLSMFALDIVSIVVQYALCPIATRDAKPQRVLSFNCGNVNIIACAPDGNIWMSDNHDREVQNGVVVVYSAEGKFNFAFDYNNNVVHASDIAKATESKFGKGAASSVQAISFSSNQAFLIRAEESKVFVHNLAGQFERSFAVNAIPTSLSVDAVSDLVYLSIQSARWQQIIVHATDGKFVHRYPQNEPIPEFAPQMVG